MLYVYQLLANQIAGKLVGTRCHVINIYMYLDCYIKPEVTGLDDKGRPVLGWNTGAEQDPNDKPPQFSNNSWSAWTQEFSSLHLQIKTSKCQIIGKHPTLPTRFSTASLWQFEEMEVVKAPHLQEKLREIQKLACWKIIVKAFQHCQHSFMAFCFRYPYLYKKLLNFSQLTFKELSELKALFIPNYRKVTFNWGVYILG